MYKRQLPFLFFALAALSVGVAHANIFIILDNPTQTGAPGSTLQFTGITSNTGIDTVYLNGDSLNLAGGGDFSINDSFFVNVPISLVGGSSSGDIGLFDVTVSKPFDDAFTTYSGTYTLLGGVDGNAQDVLGQTDFSVTVTTTPEPQLRVPVFLLGGLFVIAALRRRSRGETAKT